MTFVIIYEVVNNMKPPVRPNPPVFVFAQCGMAENGTSSTISVTSASDPAWDASGEFTYTQAIGSGCLDLNYCSGQGLFVSSLVWRPSLFSMPPRVRRMSALLPSLLQTAFFSFFGC